MNCSGWEPTVGLSYGRAVKEKDKYGPSRKAETGTAEPNLNSPPRQRRPMAAAAANARPGAPGGIKEIRAAGREIRQISGLASAAWRLDREVNGLIGYW